MNAISILSIASRLMVLASPLTSMSTDMGAFRGWISNVLRHRKQKSRSGGIPEGIRPRRLTLQRAPRQSRVALHPVIRLLFNYTSRNGECNRPLSTTHWVRSSKRSLTWHLPVPKMTVPSRAEPLVIYAGKRSPPVSRTPKYNGLWMAKRLIVVLSQSRLPAFLKPG